MHGEKIWSLPDHRVTDEHVARNRRAFMREAAMGIAGWSVAGLIGCDREMPAATTPAQVPLAMPDIGVDPTNPFDVGIERVPTAFRPAARNPAFAVRRAQTDPEVAATINNYYEFTREQEEVWKTVSGFETRPWTVEVTGRCHAPKVFDVDDLLHRMPHEERVYRFRCVEAWAMVVPWTGFPLAKLLQEVRPMRSAKYVRFVTARKLTQMPGTRTPWLPFPYYEALRIDEAMHTLSLMGTGMYGKPLPRQNGAPIRLIVPWKYGFKSIKSVVRIELTE
ncbi:MAG: protein-methionine-sulfoxide reductase catalytic subunit MsrP, partial [Myxococcota bacterium]